MIKIDFEFNSEYGVYRDAIVLPEGHGISEEQINAMKQQRFDNWKAAVSVSSEEVVEEQQGEE